MDEELFVRWAEAACLMPVMQFSAAPWRVLGGKGAGRGKGGCGGAGGLAGLFAGNAGRLRGHGRAHAAAAGIRVPGQGCGAINDQFMLGDRLLAAPLTKKGRAAAGVLPPGVWQVGGATLQSPGGGACCDRRGMPAAGCFGLAQGLDEGKRAARRWAGRPFDCEKQVCDRHENEIKTYFTTFYKYA